MRTPVLFVTALTPAVWGTTYAVTTEFLPPGRPLLAGVLRALPAGLLLLALTRRLPRGSWWWRSLVLGALNIGVFFALLFAAAYRLPGGMAAVLGAVQPLVVAGLTVLLLAERVALRTVVAGVLGAGGVTLAVLTATAALDPLGLLAGLGGTVSMALGLVLTKRWGRPGVSLLTATGWQLTAGGLVLVPVALWFEGTPDALTGPQVAGYAYLSLVGTAFAYANWFRGLEKLPAAQVSLLGLLSPLVAAVVGWAALGQSLTAVQIAGMVLAFGAVIWGQRTGPSAPRAESRQAGTSTPRGESQRTGASAARGAGREAGAGGVQHRPAEPVDRGDVARPEPVEQRRGAAVAGSVRAVLRHRVVSRADEAWAEHADGRQQAGNVLFGAALDPHSHPAVVQVGAGAESRVQVEQARRPGGDRVVAGDADVGCLVHRC